MTNYLLAIRYGSAYTALSLTIALGGWMVTETIRAIAAVDATAAALVLLVR